MKFTKIPESTFKSLQLNAGVLLTDFDPKTGEYTDENMFGATSGGNAFNAAAEYTDFGEDIDNCPPNMMELKKLNAWTVEMSGTFISLDTKSGKRLIAACDVDPEDPTHLIPRRDVKLSDFGDIWWVGDYGEEDGGYVAIHVLNALSTGGFQLQSNDDGKGTFSYTFTGHVSMSAQDVVPFEVYIVNKAAEGVSKASSYSYSADE